MSGTRKQRNTWFQFGLRSVMAMPVLVACVWWWHTWPQRTAERFHRHLFQGNVEAAQQMMESPTQHELDSDLSWVAKSGNAQFIPPRIHARSLVDWLCSRGEFNVNADLELRRAYFGRFVAIRGLMRPITLGEPKMAIVYHTRNLTADAVLAKTRAEFHSDSPAGIVVDRERSSVVVFASEATHKGFESFLQRIDTGAATLGAGRALGESP